MTKTTSEQRENIDQQASNSASMYISLNRAAKMWKRSKSHLSKLAKEGTIQWHTRPNGEKKLFLPELASYFGSPPEEQEEPARERAVVTLQEHAQNTSNEATISKLEAELQATKQLLETVQEQHRRERQMFADQIEREQANSDSWRRMAEESTQIIKALPKPEDTPKRKKLFGIFG